MDAPSPVWTLIWRMSLLVNLVWSELTDIDAQDGQEGGVIFTLTPALSLRERGIIGGRELDIRGVAEA